MVENFPQRQNGLGWFDGVNAISPALFLKGGKFIFAHPRVGEIDRGMTGEIRGNKHPQISPPATPWTTTRSVSP
jgi:hypothetical protein